MPYQPNAQSRAGELYYQGMAGLGQGIQQGMGDLAQGLLRYSENEKQRQTAAGKIQGLLSANPHLAAKADPKMMDKLSTGKATLADTMQLLGTLSTVRQQEDDAFQTNVRQAQIDEMKAQKQQRDRQNQIQDANMAALRGAAPMLAPETRGQFGARGGYVQAQPAPMRTEPDAMGAVSTYLGQGGIDPQTLNYLGQLAEAQMRSRKLEPVKPMPGSAGYETRQVPGLGTMVRDLATGEPVDGGKIIRPSEKKNDEKSLTATEIQQIQALQQAGRDLGALDQAFASIGDQDWGGPVSGPVRRAMSFGTDTNTSRIDNLVTASTPNLARGVFREVGVLTDEDIKRYRKLLPDVSDTAPQRKQKLDDLRKRMAEQTEETLSTLKAAGRDVTGLREKILGDQAKAAAVAGGPGGTGQMQTPDGVMRPIVTIRGMRGVLVGGKFHPIVE